MLCDFRDPMTTTDITDTIFEFLVKSHRIWKDNEKPTVLPENR